jgi:hypothetical protein
MAVFELSVSGTAAAAPAPPGTLAGGSEDRPGGSPPARVVVELSLRAAASGAGGPGEGAPPAELSMSARGAYESVEAALEDAPALAGGALQCRVAV